MGAQGAGPPPAGPGPAPMLRPGSPRAQRARYRPQDTYPVEPRAGPPLPPQASVSPQFLSLGRLGAVLLGPLRPRPGVGAGLAHLLCRSRRRRPGGPGRYSGAGSTPSSSRRWAAGRAGACRKGAEEEQGARRREAEGEGRNRNKRGGPDADSGQRPLPTGPAPTQRPVRRAGTGLRRSRWRQEAGSHSRAGAAWQEGQGPGLLCRPLSPPPPPPTGTPRPRGSYWGRTLGTLPGCPGWGMEPISPWPGDLSRLAQGRPRHRPPREPAAEASPPPPRARGRCPGTRVQQGPRSRPGTGRPGSGRRGAALSLGRGVPGLGETVGRTHVPPDPPCPSRDPPGPWRRPGASPSTPSAWGPLPQLAGLCLERGLGTYLPWPHPLSIPWPLNP